MKITVSYTPAEDKLAGAVLELLRAFLPNSKLRSSISHPPRKVVYLTTTNAEKALKTLEKPLDHTPGM